MTTHLILNSLAQAASWAWSTSLAIALPALLLLALGRWNGFPARARWFIGAALMLRLLLPSVPELPGMNWLPAPKIALPSIAPADRHASMTPVVTVEGTAMETRIATAAREASPDWRPLLAVAWAAGVLAVFGWIAFSHHVIRRRVARDSQPCTDPRAQRQLDWAAARMGLSKTPVLLAMSGLPTVALFGWLRPRILVPHDLCDRFSPDEVRGIFLHELAHVRRHDVLWTWLALAASALHWFNPLVWLAMKRFRADRELECDRRALVLLDDTQKRRFGEALLKTLEAHQWRAAAAVVPFAQRRPEIRTRILMITRPLATRWARLVSFIAAPCLVLLMLGHAGADGGKEAGKTGDGDGSKKAAVKDGDNPKPAGARDGETERKGPRDGEAGGKIRGPRDGEGPRKTGARDGESPKKKSSEGEGSRKETGDRVVSGNPVVLRIIDQGEQVAIGEEKVATNRLRGFLSEYLPAQAGRSVVIEADDNVPSKVVAEVLDAARDNGAKKATVRSTNP